MFVEFNFNFSSSYVKFLYGWQCSFLYSMYLYEINELMIDNFLCALEVYFGCRLFKVKFIFHNMQIPSYSRVNVQCICLNTFQARTMIPIGGHQMIFLLLFSNRKFFSITKCPRFWCSMLHQWLMRYMNCCYCKKNCCYYMKLNGIILCRYSKLSFDFLTKLLSKCFKLLILVGTTKTWQCYVMF